MVIVVGIGQCLLVKGYFIFELVLDSKAAFYEQVQGIVNSGAADGIAFVSHFEKKSFHIDVFVFMEEIKLFQNRIPLRGFSASLTKKELLKNLFCFF